MKWDEIKDYESLIFKRLIGVSKDTFMLMIREAIRLAPKSTHKIKGKKRGSKSKLRIEDKLLMLLMYYRE